MICVYNECELNVSWSPKVASAIENSFYWFSMDKVDTRTTTATARTIIEEANTRIAMVPK